MRSFFVGVLLCAGAYAQGSEGGAIAVQRLSKSVYMLSGAGGNIGLLVGEDGVLMIDSQFDRVSEKIRKEVAALSGAPIKFLINTHWHGDHVGGNTQLGTRGSVILAHENVRTRLTTRQFAGFARRVVVPRPQAALPVITFSRDLSFHMNDEQVSVFHIVAAHTDGDAVVHFTKANIIHAGDVFVRYGYPYIDVSAGGTIDGLIAGLALLIERSDENTKIIPGHGQLATRSDMQILKAMLETSRALIAGLKAEGKSLVEVLAAEPLRAYDAAYSGTFVSSERFIQTVYQTIE